MKKSDLEAVVGYMYKDEKRDFEEYVRDNGLVEGDVELDEVAIETKAREMGEGHIFCSVVAIKDFLEQD